MYTAAAAATAANWPNGPKPAGCRQGFGCRLQAIAMKLTNVA